LQNITISGGPGASVTNFVPAFDLSYVKINSSPASSSLYYTWFIDGVQYGSEMLGGMQLAYPANCSQIYQVSVKIRNSCGTSTSSCKEFSLNCTTGVVSDLGACGGILISMVDPDGVNSASSKVYPNPTQEEIQIDFSSSGQRILSLVDDSGLVVASKISTMKNDKINLIGMRKGTYFLKIKEGDKTETHRIVIE
jgi:hypothetical protein